ncbi:MAG TPA: hypothetical protein PL131_11265 [Methylotenera sp.]|nr:hypothetical protein [Methylotenera sp.]HPH06446.1 hypothetical protein [Methylotenera sp.]HPN00407.1 hypothetical protein [Methylotenera sp.]
MNQAYFEAFITNKMHYASDEQAIAALFFCNIKNSTWQQACLDSKRIKNDWVDGYFEYTNYGQTRTWIHQPFSSEVYYRKTFTVQEWYLRDFFKAIKTVELEAYILFVTFDCDSASNKTVYIYDLYIKPTDFEKLIRPNLIELPTVDLHDINQRNDPDRMILLGDTPIKAIDLIKYWKIVGADTDEKRAWNTPTPDKLVKILAEFEANPEAKFDEFSEFDGTNSHKQDWFDKVKKLFGKFVP